MPLTGRGALAIAVASAIVALLTAPAAASAGVRYATPGGGTTPGCPEATPCSLDYAITAASPGDEVVVEPGTYDVAATIKATVPLVIRGLSPSQKPRIVGATGVTPLESFEKQILRNLAVESTESLLGSLFAAGNESVFDHLELTARGNDALALRPGDNFILVDSLLLAEGSHAVGLFLQGVEPANPSLRNDTIVASGVESVGVSVFVTKPSTAVTIHATNVIADAALDASADGKEPGAEGKIEFDHSNLDTTSGAVISLAGQTAPPVFAGADDYHEAPGSPTVGAGLVDPANGETDLDGEPRVIYSYGSCAGPAPAVTDIGAYQYLSPAMPVPACIHRRRPDTRITFAKVTRRKHTARFRFRAIGAASGFECELIRRSGRHRKKPGFRRCASPKLYRHLKPGRYVFRVRAIEGRLGRLTDPTPAKRKFRI